MSMAEQRVCTIVGGGNSAHVAIPFLSQAGHKVNILTRRPSEWAEIVTCELTSMDNKVTKTIQGTLNNRSDDPENVIPQADVIILCMPVHSYRDALDRIATYVNRSKKEVFIGTIYGQAGFNWMVHEIECKYELNNIVCFALGLIPWICRTLKYGSRVANFGGKEINICACSPREKFKKLNDLVLKDLCKPLGHGKFVQACSFLSLTLSVDNQIIHPSRCYGLWKRFEGKWASMEQVPLFYADFDECSVQILRDVDSDMQLIRDAVRRHFPDRAFSYMLPYLDLERLSHKSNTPDILTSFKKSKQLGLIKTPTVEGQDGVRVLDLDCRFFTDDIPHGLLIAKWIAEKLNVSTPHLDDVIVWAQTVRARNEHWMQDNGTINIDFCMKHKNSTGIPPSYGITSIEDILD